MYEDRAVGPSRTIGFDGALKELAEVAVRKPHFFKPSVRFAATGIQRVVKVRTGARESGGQIVVGLALADTDAGAGGLSSSAFAEHVAEALTGPLVASIDAGISVFGIGVPASADAKCELGAQLAGT